jgi:hypothetical protein
LFTIFIWQLPTKSCTGVRCEKFFPPENIFLQGRCSSTFELFITAGPNTV